MIRRIVVLGLLLGLGCRPIATSDVRLHRPVPDAVAIDPCAHARGALRTSGVWPLRLESVDVDAVVEGPIARSTMTIAITHGEPDERASEAILVFELSPGAVLRELDLDVNGTWQRGRIVPRAEGRRIYEAIVGLRVDPAIAEQEHPGRVAIRVFPVPPDKPARIRMTWLQPLLEDRAPLELPLCGLPEIGALAVNVDERVGGDVHRHWVHHENLRVAAPFRVALDGGRPAAIRQGKWVAARVDAEASPRPSPIDGLTILVDTSASRETVLARDIARVEAITEALAERAPTMRIQLAAFDERLTLLYDGAAARVSEGIARLRSRGALGGTDWIGAFEAAAALGPLRRVLVVTDGVATFGTADPGAAREALRARLGDARVERLDVLGPKTLLRDAPALQWLARHGDRPGRVLDVRGAAADVLGALEQGTPAVVVELRNGRIVSANRWFDGEVDSLLLAELDDGAAWQPQLRHGAIVGRVGSASVADDLVAPLVFDAEVRRLDVERMWLAKDDERRRALAIDATRVALEHELISPHTALLALESGADFIRWGLEPGDEAGPTSSDDFANIEAFERLEPEAARLAEIQKDVEEAEKAYLRALEAWLLAHAQGTANGPPPEREPFYAAAAAKVAADFHRRLHAADPPRTDLHAKVEVALAAGAIADARRMVGDAWRSRRGDLEVALAGARVEAAARDTAAAARWLSTVPELASAGDPLHGSAVHFVDPRLFDHETFERFAAEHERAGGADASLLRAVAALARGDALLAVNELDADARRVREDAPHSARARPRRRASSASTQAADDEPTKPHTTLMAIAAAMLTPSDRVAAAATLRRHGVEPQRTPASVVLVTHREASRDELAVVIETDDHRRLDEGPGEVDRWHDLGTAKAHAHDGALPPSARLFLWRRDADGSPMVGAIYQVRFDGRTSVVTHRPFALPGRGKVIQPL